MAGTARAGVDFIVILVERRRHYHLDEINKKISIFLEEKLFEESIFSGRKNRAGGSIQFFWEEKSTCDPYVKTDGIVKNDVAWSFWRLWMICDPYYDGCVWCFCGICGGIFRPATRNPLFP